MHQFAKIASFFAFCCIALSGFAQEDTCRCESAEFEKLPESLAEKGYRERATEHLCSERSFQRSAIDRTLGKTKLPKEVEHCLLEVEKDAHVVMINYFRLDNELRDAVADHLEHHRLLTIKVPNRFEVIRKEDYLIVVTSEGIEDTLLKEVVGELTKN